VARRNAFEGIGEAGARRFCLPIAGWLSLAGVLAGCASARPGLIDSPLSIEQQQQAVLEIVPRGSSRDEAEKRLKAAGIEYRPGGKGSIYYLMLWNRPDGQRWHIDVALLFDQSGKLYQTRAASASWEAHPDEPVAEGRGPSNVRQADAALPETAPAAAVDDERIPFPKR
jgi:hypothetical protein